MTKNNTPNPVEKKPFDHEDPLDKATRLSEEYTKKYPKSPDPKGFMHDLGPYGILDAFKKADGAKIDFWYDEHQSANWRVITPEV